MEVSQAVESLYWPLEASNRRASRSAVFREIYGECRHNGQAWPYYTARILAGGAILLNNYRHFNPQELA